MNDLFKNAIRTVALLGTVFIFFLGFNFLFSFYFFGNETTSQTAQAPTIETLSENSMATSSEEEVKVTAQKMRMIFVGDLMLSRNIGKIMETEEDWSHPFKFMEKFLRDADLLFGNLESPISGRGRKEGSIYSFNADPYVVEGLKNADFNVLSIANNHSFDYGSEAFRDTIAVLKFSGIDPVGGGGNFDDAHVPVIKTLGDARIAFLAYTNLLPSSRVGEDSAPAVSYLNPETIKQDIQIAKLQSDIVVVSFHWGEEYETKHNTWQEKIAHDAIDSGATLVIGHHPHVVQEVEHYKDGYIAYSLGNFVFDQNFSPDTEKGLLLEVVLQGKSIEKMYARDVVFTKSFQPQLSGSFTIIK